MTRDSDYIAQATRHRPRTVDEMRVAVHELRARGYSDHSIAHATGLSVEYVRRTLGVAPCHEPPIASDASSAPAHFPRHPPAGPAQEHT